MRAFCVKSDKRFSCVSLYRETAFVPVLVLGVRRDDFNVFRGFNVGNAFQAVFDDLDFKRQLFFISQVLEFATAAVEENRAGRIDTVLGELNYFEHLHHAKTWGGFGNFSQDTVAGQTARCEKSVALISAKTVTAGGQGFNIQLKPVTFFDRNIQFQLCHELKIFKGSLYYSLIFSTAIRSSLFHKGRSWPKVISRDAL